MEGRAAGWYADVVFKNVITRNFQTPRQDFHGSISSPTFMEGRLIPISGEIFDVSKTNRGTIRNIVDDLFKVENFPGLDEEFKDLQFTDDDGTDWFIRAKVHTMPEYENERGGPIITFFTQLFAEDPLIRSAVLQDESGIYGLYGGVELPTVLPIALDGNLNSFTATNSGNFAATAVVTITGDITNPKIINFTTGRYFEIIADMNAGDELIIDSEARTAELNGINVLADRAEGSNWMFINPGANTVMLTGGDFDANDQGKATIKVEWYNTKV